VGALLADERLVDVRYDAAPGDRGLDQAVQLLVSSDRELQVARCNPLHLQILAGVAGQLQHLSRQVLQDRRRIDGGGGPDAAVARRAVLQMSVDPPHRELQTGPRRTRHRFGLCLARIFACFATSLRTNARTVTHIGGAMLRHSQSDIFGAPGAENATPKDNYIELLTIFTQTPLTLSLHNYYNGFSQRSPPNDKF
jgi:hypothetical protein